MKHSMSWKIFHKWAGLIATVFILLFCVSGIILNHRALFAGCNVSRNLLPSGYHITNYNNGVIKGTLPLDSCTVAAFGNVGVWLTDRDFSQFADFNAGLPKGIDHRNVKGMVKTGDGDIWCATQFGLYRLINAEWKEVTLPGNEERISDITMSPDSTGIVVLTRSAGYTVPLHPGSAVQPSRITINPPTGYNPKVTLFKTVWMLHSGELFGTVGKLAVDAIAIVISFLCITGIILFILPRTLRKSLRTRSAGMLHKRTSILKWNFHWHDRIGYVTVILTILLAVTGMCLRPPLMIPMVMTETAPLPGSTLDNENAWHDKLRGLRWDAISGKWLISTSEGFIAVNEDFSGTPDRLPSAPPVSPMGINVFEPREDGEWLIGSFSGLYRWNPSTGDVTDYFTGEPYNRAERRRISAARLISGFTNDLNGREPIVFDYSKGAENLPPTDALLASQPMSLWNVALELHVGRCYAPVLGVFSELFVFLSGLILTLILLSGYIVHRQLRRKRH